MVTFQNAEAIVRWYLNEAEADACGLRAAAWHHTEEVTAAGEVVETDARRARHGYRNEHTVHVGAQSRAYHEVDAYPERAGWARAKLRQAHTAWTKLEPWAQAVLEARFSHDGGRRPTVPGCGLAGRVVEMLAEVRKVAEARKETPREACIATMKGRTDELTLRAETAIAEALGAFAVAWREGSAEKVRAFRARLAS